MEIRNNTRAYWNQYFDVTDIPETDKDERIRTCNITCVAMIIGKHPDEILHDMFDKYGKNDKFQWEEHLIAYLRENGYRCNSVTKIAWPKPRQITDDELKTMMNEIKDGKIIFYHKKGHYQLMIGFVADCDDISFIFNDPAGDRKIPVYKRERDSGNGVIYPLEMVKHEIIYGQCYSVEI